MIIESEHFQSPHCFNALCGLPMVVGAISGLHIEIFKPRVGLVNCFYLKVTHGYILNCQAIVDSRKGFFGFILRYVWLNCDA